MNERLKELAQEAGLETVDFPFDEFGFPVELLRFAGLIVRECAILVDEHHDPCEPWMDGRTVLEHFGVQE